ncbi:MAG: prepilin-type N-terminal cleavage/methylation domain-containing protein, partial [Rhodocyclaceae bacterium]|nr:prepilin-type N-terminal cleavage/methylation domain-containing protein [Rhodocyclaceae bacterium]
MGRQQSGFTLVEMAVVLVIIGLLLGGVLKGQELINSAKAKSLVNDFRATATFVYGYQDRFRALPGDDAAADTHIGGTKATTGGTVGNGRIDGNWNSTTVTDESVLFWQHVRLANLTSGTTAAPTAETITGWLPRNAEGGRIGITSAAPI